MSSRTGCSLLIDRPADGSWNMAVDESLLDSFAEADRCCWRFYRWNEPTLSLGYFQSSEDRQQHPSSLVCPIVRRASGGGAIVHDVELTYSFVAPAGSCWSQHPHQLYELIHSLLVDVLGELGMKGASLFSHTGGTASEQKPFLCFQRRFSGDVIYGEAKIAGSAQRRRRRAVLQHGSVLLASSSAAPELPGICELTGCELTFDELVDRWLPRLESNLKLTFSDHALTDTEKQTARQYVETKYGSDRWTVDRHWRP